MNSSAKQFGKAFDDRYNDILKSLEQKKPKDAKDYFNKLMVQLNEIRDLVLLGSNFRPKISNWKRTETAKARI